MVKRSPGFIRIVSRLYLPEPAAASLLLAGVANGCVESGSDVEVVTTTIPKQLGETEISVPYRLRRAPVLRNKDGYMRGYLQYLSFDLPLFFRLLFSRRPALTLVEPPPTTGVITRIAYKILGIPYVYNVPDIWSIAAQNVAPKLVCRVLRWMESFAIRGAVHVIAISDEVAKLAADLGAENITVIPNGIDTDLFTHQGEGVSTRVLQEMGINQDPFFVYTGIASERHGAVIFIDAFKKIRNDCPDLHLVFMGQGTEWESLLEAVKDPQLAGYFHVLNNRSPQEVACWNRSARVGIASLVDGGGYEFAYPTKLLSSLSCGIPVLYTGPGPAVKDIQNNDLGWACDYETNLLAKTMKEAYYQTKNGISVEKQKHYRQWVKNNRSLTNNGHQIAKLFHDLVNNRRK